MSDDRAGLPRCEQGHPSATPGCGCSYCTAVFDEWGEQAEGFQRWYETLDPAAALVYFGEVRHG